MQYLSRALSPGYFFGMHLTLLLLPNGPVVMGKVGINSRANFQFGSEVVYPTELQTAPKKLFPFFPATDTSYFSCC